MASTCFLRCKSIPLAMALVSGIWSADIASATDSLGTPVGTVNFTLATYPGSPTAPAGGGPFQLALSTPVPSNLLTSLGIPSSVQAWCVETSEEISPGHLNTSVQLLSQGPSQIGGMIAEGLKWLNVVSTGGTGGYV